jgi:hypothetical protein
MRWCHHRYHLHHSLPQLIRLEPLCKTEEALEILNALMGRFPDGSVVGEAILTAILEIERDIDKGMKQ